MHTIMRTMRRLLCRPACLLLLVFDQVCAAPPAWELPALTFDKDLHGFYLNVEDEVYLRYMWDSFVALNWPATARVRGQVDIKCSGSRHTTSGRVGDLPHAWRSLPAIDEVAQLPNMEDIAVAASRTRPRTGKGAVCRLCSR